VSEPGGPAGAEGTFAPEEEVGGASLAPAVDGAGEPAGQGPEG
jgi:hypothetical protein